MEEYDVESILDMYESDYVREPGSIPIGPRGMVGEITDEQTQFNRPIYQTPGGERVSEKSTTLFLNGNWINVPSIHGGKSFNEDELRLMIKRGNIEPTSVHKSKADAEAAAQARSSSMVPGPRNMYASGQLVQNTIDGSRPGYSGDGMEEAKVKVANKYAQLEHKKNYYDLGKKESAAIRYIMKKHNNKFFKNYKIKEKNVKRFETKKENLLKKTFNLTDADFLEHGKFGVPQKIDGKINPKHTQITNFIKRDFSLPKVTKKDILTPKQITNIKDNFDLPDGVKEWNFKSIKNPQGFKYGISGSIPGPFKTGYPKLFKQIKAYIENPPKRTIQANTATTKGWMMAAMERVYNNQIKSNVKFKNLTYQPIKKNNIIVGFKDTTPSGNNKIYYGLNKNAEEFGDGADWTNHGDYKKIDKFIDIANRVKANPDDVLKKILNKKGINTALRLNDILSHQRYYETLSETTPKTLLQRQVVLHHTGGVGAADNVARAAATKDIQLLTGAINAKVGRIENELAKTGIVSAEDNKFLKNSGARIKGADGKIYGGGFINPERQYKSIEKDALKYAKSDKFNVKTVASYLERLGCGRAAGGRILFSEGAPSLTKCAQKGVAKLEKGLITGFKNADDMVLAKGILKSGRFLKDAVSLRGLFGPAALAFTAAAEAGIVGYDMLSSGKSFREAVGDSVFNYMLGDKTKIDSVEERNKRMIEEGMTPEQMGKIGAMESALEELNMFGSQFDKLATIQKNRDAISMSPEDAFNESAFQLDLDRQENEALQNIQDFNRTGAPQRLQNIDFAGGFENLAEGLRRNELAQLQDAGIGKIYQSRLGDEKRTARIRELMLQNPDVRNYMGPYPTNYGFMEGGIASLNVKK